MLAPKKCQNIQHIYKPWVGFLLELTSWPNGIIMKKSYRFNFITVINLRFKSLIFLLVFINSTKSKNSLFSICKCENIQWKNFNVKISTDQLDLTAVALLMEQMFSLTKKKLKQQKDFRLFFLSFVYEALDAVSCVSCGSGVRWCSYGTAGASLVQLVQL